MNLSTNCKNCSKSFEIKSSAPSRHELENEKGRYFQATCPHCQSNNEYHVNDVIAEEKGLDVKLLSILGVASVALVAFAYYSFGLIGFLILAVPFLIYTRYKSGLEKSITLFNQSDISRTRPKTR